MLPLGIALLSEIGTGNTPPIQRGSAPVCFGKRTHEFVAHSGSWPLVIIDDTCYRASAGDLSFQARLGFLRCFFHALRSKQCHALLDTAAATVRSFY